MRRCQVLEGGCSWPYMGTAKNSNMVYVCADICVVSVLYRGTVNNSNRAWQC